MHAPRGFTFSLHVPSAFHWQVTYVDTLDSHFQPYVRNRSRRPVSPSVFCLPVLSLFVESDPSSALTVFMQPDVASTFS